MSLYNMVNGVNQATFYILPMLGKHPDEYPRFRDCFAGVAKNDEKEVDQFGIPTKSNDTAKPFITVYTRTGGDNRDGYSEQNKELTEMETYVEDYDDDYDSTFAYWVFSVPEKFVDDYNILIDEGDARNVKDLSEEYKKQIIKVFPKLEDKLKELLY